MGKERVPGAEQYTAQNNRRRIWQRIVGMLACVVVFVTTYALILPAITMEKAAVCGFEEHSHTEECFDADDPSVRICALEEHTHTDECRTSGETTAATEEIPVQTTEAIPQITEANQETESVGDLVISDEGIWLLSTNEVAEPVVLSTDLNGVSYPDFETEMNGSDRLKLSKNVSIWIDQTDAWRESGDGTGVGGYQFWTGQAATIYIDTGSSENSTYRLYFQFTKAGGGLDVSPKDNGDPKEYTFHGQPVTCYATKDPNTVCLEFTPAAGVTADIPIRAWYTSPDTAGGSLRVWGMVCPTSDESNTEEETSETIREVKETTDDKSIQFSWHTQADPFVLGASIDSHHVSITKDVIFHSENRGILPEDMTYIMTMKSTGDPAVTWGRNYGAYTEVSAYLDLDILKGFSWNEEFINAIATAGNSKLYGKHSIDGDYRVYTFYAGDTPITRFAIKTHADFQFRYPFPDPGDAWVSWENGKPVFHCRVYNITGTSGKKEDLPKEMASDIKEIRFTVCRDALTIVADNDPETNNDFNAMDSDGLLKCHFEAEVHYSHDDLTANGLKSESSFGVNKGNFLLGLWKHAQFPKYFGEGFTYTYTLKNSGIKNWNANDDENCNHYGKNAQFEIYDILARSTYITPENMQRMFEKYGKDLIIEIGEAACFLEPWQEVTGTDGNTTVYLHPGNTYHPDANSEESRYKLTINYNDETGLYQVAVAKYTDNTYNTTVPTSEYTGNSVEEVLRKAGYGVNASDYYIYRWAQNEADTACLLQAGETKIVEAYVNIKDTFQISSQDWVGQYSGGEINVGHGTAYFGPRDITNFVWTGKIGSIFGWEASLSKDIKKGVEVLEGNFKVKAGDVLDHQITLTNAGTGIYENLPIVDEIYGTQYLLAPVIEENAHLADMELDTYGDFYVLNKAGTYENVCVGVDEEGNYLNAATITVAGLGEAHNVGEALSYGGVHTQIKWYFAQTNDVSIHYQTQVPQELQGAYSIGGTTWANDRVGARLYTSMWGGGSVIGHDKDIVLERGETPEQDVLADYSVVKPGDQVTYRLTLRSEEAGTITLSGVNMADNLPDTFGLFDWVKGGNISEISVGIPEDKAGKITCTEQLITEWSVGGSYGSLQSEGERYILWTDKAAITFEGPGEVYLYYTLTYPGGAGEEELWDQYVDAVNGNRVENAFYVYKNPVTAEHELWETGKVLLQKGVADTYIISYHAYNANSRQYFNNEDSFGREIAYYVTLYNGGNKRLYLNDMEDKLPAGTTFIKCIYNANRLVNNPITTIGGTELDASSLIQTILPENASKVVFRSAAVSGTAADGIATFTFGAGSGDYAVSYDSARGQYYLNQNEAIVFGYLVKVGTATETGGELTNTIAMAYTDYSGTGVEIVSGDRIEVKAAPSDYYPDYNDGDCRVLSAQQVQEAYGLTAGAEQNWLVSQVTSTKGKIAPGVTKHTDSYMTGVSGDKLTYTGSVGPFDTVNWRIRVYNTGTAAMTNFTLTDILPYPYVIEGDLTCSVYSQHEYGGTTMLLQHICTLPIRTVDEKEVSGTHYRAGETSVYSYTLIYGAEPTANIREFMLGLKRDAGNECVTLKFAENMLSIPENCYMDVEFSARNPSGDIDYKVFTNRAVLTPTQKFNQGEVTYGRVARDASGNALNVENTALVTVNAGFSTSSVNTVTGNANTNASAASSDMVRSITLANPEDTFTYTLSVTNNTDVPMNKLVLIDSLPQPEDTSPFDTHVKRGSDFTVVLEEEANFVVQVKAENETVTTLDPDQYSLEYSTATDFGGGQSDDWMGENTGKWNASAAEARAIRIIIKDKNGTLIPDGATVSVSFDVKAADPEAVEPGQTAWNTFGYHYAIKVNDKTTESQTTESQTTESKTTELEAMPLEVGVSIPRERKLQKKLVDPEGKPAMISGEESFAFLLYEGEPMSLDFEGDWGTALTDAGRAYKTFAVTIPAGSTESQPVSLNWTWKTGAAYTLVEMPVGDGYRTESLGGSAGNSHRFQYDPKQAVTMECVNVLEHWSIRLTKTDEKDRKLSGAVFALYSPSQADQISVPAGYGDLEIAAAIDRKTAAQETKRWYLAGVAESDKDGVILWKGLLRDSYLLVEVKAPAGYMLSNPEGQPVYRDGLVKELTVVNYSGYELPETGGAGTVLYYIAGSALSTMAAWGLGKKKRKQTGQD